MRLLLTIVLFFAGGMAMAQEGEMRERMKGFHEAMTQGAPGIGDYVDDSLSYGHSNGWVENKWEFLSDLGSLIIYHAFRVDSLHISVSGDVAHARFAADVDATMSGKRMQFHLRVLEVWIKKANSWKLFARQAIK